MSTMNRDSTSPDGPRFVTTERFVKDLEPKQGCDQHLLGAPVGFEPTTHGLGNGAVAFGSVRRRSSMRGLIWPFAILGFDAVRRGSSRFGDERYHGVTTQPAFRPWAIGGDDESRALSTLVGGGGVVR